MPFVKVYINKDIQKKTQKNISDSIHQSLLESFNIPVKDKFQVFVKLDADDLIFPDEYLGNNYSNIIYINITCKEGRTKDQKKQLYELCANKITETTDINRDDVFITIIENNKDNWSFGNGIAQLME
jgi:4-oxalocrotonate tautomerase family enzyme